MNLLALDLGTSTGAATSRGSETWVLADRTTLARAGKLRLNRRLDVRVITLWSRLNALHAASPLDWIVFEDVQFGKSLAQVQLWSSFRGVVWAFAIENRLSVECLETWKLKEFGAGSAAAGKPEMAAALVRKHPDVYTLETGLVKRTETGIFLSDDEVDALHLYDWAQRIIK